MLKFKLIFIAASLLLALGCSSSEDDSDPVDLPDTSNPGETGGEDAAPPPPPPPPPPPVSAASLGQVCDNATPCPTDYECLAFTENATAGLCSLSCPTSQMPAGCDAAAGFPGPGAGVCLDVGPEGMPANFCIILCGADFGGDACPTGLVCTNVGGTTSACLNP